jgi:hypothetical protein
MRRAIATAIVAAAALAAGTAGLAAAHPDNAHSLHFVLTCDDGQVWDASINGGSSSFHLDGEQMYVWKQIDYVTPDGVSGSIRHGIQGFAGAPLVVCTYIGAISGNAYTVTGFYPPAS